ncbi:MAG: hypothetical protein JW840_01390 [Candidatus Thermoplasmatota archaeon]|nr:hypothetical protein [Candidatus Thermoplasmatota archaeon]
MSLEDDPFLGKYFNTAEKKARWIFRLKILYILWIVLVILGILSLVLWFLFK